MGEPLNIGELDKEISATARAAQSLADDHTKKPELLTDLGDSLKRRFELLGDPADINKAVEVYDAAANVPASMNHPDKLEQLSNLGDALLDRFDTLGALADVERAIGTHEDAVRLADDDVAKQGHLRDLGTSLLQHFERNGDVDQLDRMVEVFEDATNLLPDAHPEKPAALHDLGDALLQHFDTLNDTTELDLSISAFEDAVRITPADSPARATSLNSLAAAVLIRFKQLGNVADVNRAVEALKEALDLTPAAHPSRPARLCNLGGAILGRFGLSGETSDADASIATYKEALELTPNGHPDKPAIRSSLGSVLMARFERLGEQQDIDAATEQFSSAAKSRAGPPSIRLRTASHWANCCIRNNTSPMEAYNAAMGLLPRVSWLGVAPPEEELANVVRDATAAAITAGEYQRAVEWLEMGQTVVQGLAVHLPTEVDALRAKDATLADLIEQLAVKLKRAGTKDDVADPNSQPSVEEVAQAHRLLTDQWDSLVARASAIPGLENFLKPKPYRELTRAAAGGPVVVLNVQRARCDALVVSKDKDVVHVPLPEFSEFQVYKLAQSLSAILSSPELAEERGTAAGSSRNDRKFKVILSDLWTQMAKPVLERLNIPLKVSRGEGPRLWWCATGPLALLPIHAAGLYDTATGNSKVSDYVVSSYTSTLTPLLEAPHTSPPHGLQLVAVDSPSNPDSLAQIERLRGRLTVTSFRGEDATPHRVLEGLVRSSWVHFACPGQRDMAEPEKSALRLPNGTLPLVDIIKAAPPRLAFAFLAACEPAAVGGGVAQESVHLAGGLALAGYQSVIAAAWTPQDDKADFIVGEVYQTLLQGRAPDHTRAALALHNAVARLREQSNVSFVSWVPFVHVGL